MIRIVSPRIVCATTSKRPFVDIPKVTKRSSPDEWSGSVPVTESRSRNTVDASSNETLCLRSSQRPSRDPIQIAITSSRIKLRRPADRQALDLQRRLADSDRHALPFLAAGADAGVELEIVA